MKSQARVVVIGGGAVGCSALYHLTRLGWTDVVLLERDELTAGSTWHAAGNCPNFSTCWSILKLQRYSTTLYRRLAQGDGVVASVMRDLRAAVEPTSSPIEEDALIADTEPREEDEDQLE